MTVKEFYDYAVHFGLKNAEILINYECSDCWYSLENEKVTKDKIDCSRDNKKIFINV